MIPEEVIGNDGRPFWLCRGEGPMRPILTEGGTYDEARKAFLQIYGDQYAEMEQHTHFAERRFDDVSS